MTTIGEEHFKNLVAVAYADGVLDKKEEELLSLKAIEFGLSEATVEFILDTADQIAFLIPRTIIDREKQLKDSADMATIDGNLQLKEYNLLVSLALRLGYQPSSVDKVIEKLSIEREIIVEKG